MGSYGVPVQFSEPITVDKFRIISEQVSVVSFRVVVLFSEYQGVDTQKAKAVDS